MHGLDVREGAHLTHTDLAHLLDQRPPRLRPSHRPLLLRPQRDDLGARGLAAYDLLEARSPGIERRALLGIVTVAFVNSRDAALHMVQELRDGEPLHTHRSEEHTSELQSLTNLVCRLLLEKKKKKNKKINDTEK